VLNEILADPGFRDANCDGRRDSSQDQFIELVNTGGTPLDLGGVQVSDASGVRHTVRAGLILESRSSYVLFGGGSPDLTGAGPDAWCGPVRAVIDVASTGRLDLTDTGDTVGLTAPDGSPILRYTFGTEASEDQSIVRSPEVSDADMVRHTEVAGADGPWSPGTRVDGGSF
jgi:hypothetical protein